MTTRIGVIGTGQIAKMRHIPEYAAHPNVTLAAFCDSDEAKAAALARQYNVKSVCTDFKELLAMDTIDAVSICTPNYLHAPMAVAAAEAGKHVLVEKPMATSLDEADAMIAAAEANRVFLMVGQNQRLAPLHVLGRQILASGMLGSIHSFRTTFGHPGPEHWSPTGAWFFDKKEAWAGALADLGVHKADLMRWLIGDEVRSISAFTARREKAGDVEDNAVCLLQFAGGIIGTLTASWTMKPNEDNATIIYGERGTLKLGADPDEPVVVEFAQPGKGRAVFDVPTLQSNEADGQFSSGVIDAFVHAIRTETPPAIDGKEGRRALEIVLGALLAVQKKTVISLPLQGKNH